MTEYRCEIKAPPETIDDIHRFLAQIWQTHPEVASADRMALDVVLVELVANVIQHNAGIPVICSTVVTIGEKTIAARISDTGGEVVGLPERSAMPDVDSESGRGLALIRMLTDSFEYQRDGEWNVWTLKRSREE